MTESVNIPVKAQFDAGSVNRGLDELTAKVNKLGAAVAAANKLKFSPVEKGSREELSRMEAQFQAILRQAGPLRNRIAATGQLGKWFADLDLPGLWSDPRSRGGSMLGLFNRAAEGTSFAGRFSAANAPSPAPGPGGGGGGGGGTFPGQGIVNAGLNAAGPVGRVASGALNAGVSGGLMAGVGAMAGGLAALGIGKVVGAIKDKVSDAEQESIGYDTLKRQLGDVGVGFERLRSSLRDAAAALDTNYQESQKLGESFTKLANLSGERAGTLAGEVRTGGGMARALGLDLGQGVGFMAQMRLGKVTGSEQDSKRLALLIGEAVGKVGFGKADEVLAAVSSFTAQQSRNSLTAANASGFLSSLVGLSASGRAGLDPSGAAALLSRVNSSIMGGGAAGEAGQNFLFSTLGRGLTPIQAKILQEQGAFGTRNDAFGSGSLYSQFATRFGGKVPGGGSATNLSGILQGLQKNYGGDYLAAATSNLLGVNNSQAMALHLLANEGGLGSIQKRLGKAGIDLNSVNASGIGALGKIATGGIDVLNAQSASLWNRTGRDALSEDERKRLRTAMESGDVEQMRDVLTELTATREQEKTEGSETRKSIEGVSRETQRFATALIPIANTTRDAVVALAQKLAPDSAFAKAAKMAEAQKALDAQISASDADLKKFDDETAQIHAGEKYQKMPEGMRKVWDDERARIRAMKVSAQDRDFGSSDSYSSGADALMGALINAESSGNHYGPDGRLLTSSAGAQGITQVMPATGKDPGYGVKPLQNNSPEEYKRFGRDYLAAMLRRYRGDKSKSLAAYNWGAGNVDKAVGTYGDGWLQSAPAETQAYVKKILSTQGQGGQLTGTATVEVNVIDKKTKAPLGAVQTTLTRPTAAGK